MANLATKKSNSKFGFISETIAELKKVSWLSRREAFYLTGLVLLIAITVGAILGAIDSGFSFLINELIGGG